MFITVEATYESGVLKLHQPLPLDEHTTVRVTVATDKVRAARPAGEPWDFGEGEMLDIVLNVPPSPAARTVVARRGPLPLPDPPVIPPEDDEIE